MDDKQFDKLVALNQATADSVENLAQEQKRQSESLSEYGDNLEELTSTVGDLKGQTEVSFAKLGTRLDTAEDRAKEDRSTVDQKIDKLRDEARASEETLEGKIGKAHDKNQKTDKVVGAIRGELDNHMKDEHATNSAHTAEKLNAHLDDNNRHGGEAPGKTGTAKTVGIAAGSGGVLLLIAEFLRQWLSGS